MAGGRDGHTPEFRPNFVSPEDEGIWIEMEGPRGKRPKGEPYSRVKEKARYMAGRLYVEQIYAYDKEGALDPYERIIAKLIESAPQQTLQALCDVLDPDATT